MSQAIYVRRGEQVSLLEYPNFDDIVVDDIRWGRVEEPLTPAFWAHQCALHLDSMKPTRFRVGTTLAEEFAVCMLAGYGVPAEIGMAAAEQLKQNGLLELDRDVPCAEIEAILRAPLEVNGRTVRYRFFRTKARYIAEGLRALRSEQPPEDAPLKFRAWFRTLPGVGPKTASFITRNWLGTDDVAILDIHVVRACQILRLFPAEVDLARDYARLEERFLKFANTIRVPASWLDAVMWDDMRSLDDDIVLSALHAARADVVDGRTFKATAMLPIRVA